jgi:hypothetical protein
MKDSGRELATKWEATKMRVTVGENMKEGDTFRKAARDRGG